VRTPLASDFLNLKDILLGLYAGLFAHPLGVFFCPDCHFLSTHHVDKLTQAGRATRHASAARCAAIGMVKSSHTRTRHFWRSGRCGAPAFMFYPLSILPFRPKLYFSASWVDFLLNGRMAMKLAGALRPLRPDAGMNIWF